jgi:uncharacterized protein YjdB
VTITVIAANGKLKKIKVVAVSKAASLKKITATMPTGDAMKVGQIFQTKVKLSSAAATNVKVTFTSNNKSVLKVDKVGKLVALKLGTANVTVKAGGKKFTKMITVKS